MTPPDQEIQQFVKRLTLGTRKGQVKWIAKAEGWFELESAGTTVVIRSESEDLDHPYTFTVTNDEGMTLVAVATIEGGAYAGWEIELDDLFRAARNQALNIDDTLKGLTDKLGLPDLPKPDDDIPF